MPRGKKTASSVEAPIVKKPPKRKAGVSKRKKMEVNDNKVTVGRKRKQKATYSGELIKNDVTDVPESKKQRSSSKQPVEETDRAIFTMKAPSKNGAEPVSKTKVETLLHHSHKYTPGEVMTFGQGDIGQLGLGEDVMERKKPFPVRGDLEGKKIVQVVCGGMHTVAVSDDGLVYTWGCNDEGALGRPTEEGEEYDPGLVRKIDDVKVVQVSAGDSHSAALTDTGRVYCWGIFRDSSGPFGLIKPYIPSPTPELVFDSEGRKAIKIGSGSDHVIILSDDGDIYSFGCAEQGQLGRVPECFSVRGGRKGLQLLLEPQVIRFRKSRGHTKPKFSDVFCGLYHVFALTVSNTVYCWGLNNYGQLGTNDVISRYQPEQLPDDWIEGDYIDGDTPSLQISGGQHHSIVCHKGSVYVLGRREYGRLGLGEKNVKEPLVPERLSHLNDVDNVGVGSVCSFAVTKFGKAYSWGMGTNLQLGTGNEDDIWEPSVITGKYIDNRKVVNSSSGGQHTALLVGFD